MDRNKTQTVSVIIPTYNRANFVTKAIDSVLAQTFADYEIIVIDDGSTDNTKEVLDPYRGKIQYIHQENSGVSAARNAGIRMARGNWVAFLDSDDEWMPEYLECQMQRAKEEPKICMHMTNQIQIKISGEKINTFEEKNILNKFEKTPYIIIERPFVFVIRHLMATLQPTVICRNSLLSTGLFNEDLTIYEDMDLIARMSLKGPLGIYERPLVLSYHRDKSTETLTDQYYKKAIYSRMSINIVYDNLAHDKRLNSYEKDALRQIRSSNQRCIANLFLEKGEKIKARIFFKRAFITYPSAKSLLKYLITYLPIKINLFFIKDYSFWR